MNTDLRDHRHRFPMDIISQCVWLYFRFCLSYRDVEEMMAERCVVVSHETIRTWCSKFGGDDARRLKAVHYCEVMGRRFADWRDICALEAA